MGALAGPHGHREQPPDGFTISAGETEEPVSLILGAEPEQQQAFAKRGTNILVSEAAAHRLGFRDRRGFGSRDRQLRARLRSTAALNDTDCEEVFEVLLGGESIVVAEDS